MYNDGPNGPEKPVVSPSSHIDVKSRLTHCKPFINDITYVL